MGKITVNRHNMNEALNFVKNLVPQNAITDADKNIRFAYKEGVFTVTATDGIQGAKAVVDIVAVDDDTEDFSGGVSPKNLLKAVAKDVSENMQFSINTTHLVIESDNADDYTTFPLANMRRAHEVMSWIPKNPSTDTTLGAEFFVETLAFLDDFLPDGKDMGAKHAVVVLSNKVAHATNGVNLRGICASSALAFTSDVSLRKRYLTQGVRALKFLKCEKLRVVSNTQLISISSEDAKKILVMPSRHKKPPVVPKEYLRPTENYLTLDLKAATRGVDKISASNYNTASVLTGVDLQLSGTGDDAKLKVVLDDDKASQTFSCTRMDDGDLEKTLDVKTFHKMLKMFQKSKEAKMEMGGDDSRFLRFFDKREIGEVTGAFIAVCSYSRKI